MKVEGASLLKGSSLLIFIMTLPYPRLVIAGTAGDSGKTIVSMGLLAALKRRRLKTAAFKKGPDYIDAAWLARVSDSPARNLDTFLSGFNTVKTSFFQYADSYDISIIEGNRGLFDGSDPEGTHSTAELAKLLDAPVVLVHNVTKVTRTAAALLTGCAKFDPDVNIAGFVLNRLAGPRHERVITEALKQACDIPVVGCIRKLPEQSLLPDRHLGLVTPAEFGRVDEIENSLADIAEKFLDVSQILEISRSASSQKQEKFENITDDYSSGKIKINYFCDSAFNFYYPENLEALEKAGAELIPVSSIKDSSLPEADGLYIGGGFPETHAELLAENEDLRNSVKEEVKNGLPVYAECGGLLYLCKSLEWQNSKFPMAGVFPVEMRLEARPQGHGYCEVLVDTNNPFYPQGSVFKGHEFHYSHIVSGNEKISTVFDLKRGTGIKDKRDGMVYKNVLATFVHIHSTGTPEWLESFIRCIKQHKKSLEM